MLLNINELVTVIATSVFQIPISVFATSVFQISFSVNSADNRRYRLRFVYNHFKSCDQSLDKISFDFSYIFLAMQSCAMCAKSRTILKLPKGYGHMS